MEQATAVRKFMHPPFWTCSESCGHGWPIVKPMAGRRGGTHDCEPNAKSEGHGTRDSSKWVTASGTPHPRIWTWSSLSACMPIDFTVGPAEMGDAASRGW